MIVLLVKTVATMIRIAERLNAVTIIVIAVGGRLEDAIQKRNRGTIITLAKKPVVNVGYTDMLLLTLLLAYLDRYTIQLELA